VGVQTLGCSGGSWRQNAAYGAIFVGASDVTMGWRRRRCDPLGCSEIWRDACKSLMTRAAESAAVAVKLYLQPSGRRHRVTT
jgi:hypothetical protein